MQLKDYRLLTLAVLCGSAKLRREFAYRLNEEMFDDPKERALVIPLQKSNTTAELVEATKGVGGLAYIKYLGKHAKRYGRISAPEVSKWLEFLENAMKQEQVRVLLQAAEDEVKKLSLQADSDPLIAKLVDGLVAAYNPERERGYVTLDSLADDLSKDILDLHDGITRDKVPTGFDTLDTLLEGGLPYEVITLGGIPGVGKTQLAIQIGENVARQVRQEIIASKGRRNSGVVPIISAEMTDKSLYGRLVQARTGITLKAGISANETATVLRAIEEMRDLPLLIDDSSLVDYTRLEALYTRYGAIRLVIGDYAELLAKVSSELTREQQVAKVFITAKIIVKRYGCPFLLITQLNRTMEKTASKIPTMRDIRYTGMGEAISGVVLLIYYPYEYVMLGQAIRPPSTMPAQPGVAYNIAAKNRWGPTGFVPMGWIGSITRWEDRPRAGMYHTVGEDEVWQPEQTRKRRKRKRR